MNLVYTKHRKYLVFNYTYHTIEQKKIIDIPIFVCYLIFQNSYQVVNIILEFIKE